MGHRPAAIVEPDAPRRELLGTLSPGCPILDGAEESFQTKADAVIVCSPTDQHAQQALAALDRGLPVFVEKPVSYNLEETDALVEGAAEARVPVLVACNLRFLPSLNRVKSLLEEGRIGKVLVVRANCGYYLPFWRPKQNYRQGYGAKREIGGVILDCIHEFDYLQWLLGEITEISCIAGRQSFLEIESEDTASMIFRFDSGAIGNLHLDYLQRTYRRSCEFVGGNGMIVWDYITQKVTLYDHMDRHSEVFDENVHFELNQMFVDEMKHFIACTEGTATPLLDASRARAILRVALAARESSRDGKLIQIAP